MTISATEMPPPRVSISWLELSCFTCGELAGYVEDSRLVRPTYPGAVRVEARSLRCGRCNGMLISGHCGVANSRDLIGSSA